MYNLEKLEELKGLVIPQQIPFNILHSPDLNVSGETMFMGFWNRVGSFIHLVLCS